MSHGSSPEFDAWVNRARKASIIEMAKKFTTVALKGGGAGEQIGPCQVCGGKDRFQVKEKEGVFLCRGSGCGPKGSDGGDVITMVMHVQAVDFVGACELINGEPPPRSAPSEPRPYDDGAQRARQEAQKDRQSLARIEDESEYERKCRQSEELFARGQSIQGSFAWRYLTGTRGLSPSHNRIADLRFIPALTYWGFEHPDADSPINFGELPCMIAAIRDRKHRIIGVHRTYFDPDQPRKVEFEVDPDRNKAKKVFGNGQGGLIWLGPVCASIAIAEGIETALSWETLAPSEADFTVCAAYSLSNLSGKCTGSTKHPTMPNRTIINGIPDLADPGIILPADVQSVTILGDGDPAPQSARTRRAILAGARRFSSQGKIVSIAMAPDGKDWNDVLLEQAREARAA